MGPAVPGPVVALILATGVLAVGADLYRLVTGRDLPPPLTAGKWRAGSVETRRRAAIGLLGVVGLVGLVMSNWYIRALPSVVAALIFAVCMVAAGSAFYWILKHRRF